MDIASTSVGKRKRVSLANAGLYETVIRWSLYALFFFLPIFFLPFTNEAFEVSKQTLMVILAFVALLAWLGSMVMEKKLAFRAGWLNLLPALLLLGGLVSSIFSLAGYQSWVGQSSQEYTSFLTLAVSVVIFYVLMNKAGETTVQRNIFFAILSATSLSALITLLNIFGLGFIPFLTAHGANTVGTITSFTVFLTIMMVFSMGMWLVGKKERNDFFPVGIKGAVTRGLVIFLSVATTILLVAIDFWVLWVLAIFGMLLVMVFVFLQQNEFGKSNRFIVPLIIILISIFLLFLTSPIKLNLPLVIGPSYGTSWDITKQVLSDGPMPLIFGSGPGTFSFDYTKYKPDEVNQTIFWDTNFDRAKSQGLTTLATFGVVGLGFWLLLVLVIGLKALGRLLKEREHDEWKITYVLFASWATLILANLLYSSNMSLTFLFWALTGLLASQVALKIKETGFVSSPKLGLVFSFAFVLVSVGVIVTLFVTGQRYASEVAFAKAVELDNAGAPIEQITAKLGEAVSLNSLSDIYYRNLSQAFLLRTKDTITTATADESKIDANEASIIQQLVKAAMTSADRAAYLSPNNVSNWVQRGNVYRDVMPVVTGAEDVAAASYLKAMELEDNNPAYSTGLARLYLAVSDRARNLKSSTNKELAASAVESEKNSLVSAEQYLNQSIVLKADYAPAHYYLAAVLERQGKLKDAAARLAALRDYKPLDVGLGFQLSMLYIRLTDYDSAQKELERILELSPNYSNARWYLASMYEIDGKLNEAINQVAKVAELNPGNQAVQTRLSKLKSGQLTTQVPTPVEEGEETATTVEGGEVQSE
ncbi:MAG: tetratricopeptide repeat protein [Patescibacteria group bacterium]|jgi:tetratricopeptide (TPR) repeat protein